MHVKILLGLCIVTTSAWAGELMILDSTETTLPVAEIIADDIAISLPTGARITLVSETGEEFTLVGPFEGLPDPANAAPLVNYMVVESDLEELPIAEVLSGDQRLEIPEGSRVVLVAESGQELILEGPFQGFPGEAQSTEPTDGDPGAGASVGTTRSF